METSIFFARFIGFYLVIVLVALLLNYSRFKDIALKTSTPNRTFITGVCSLIFGLVVVLLHNVWEWDWRVLITLIGWLSLIKGVVRIYFTDWATKTITKFAENKVLMIAISIIFIIIGLILLYYGYSE